MRSPKAGAALTAICSLILFVACTAAPGGRGSGGNTNTNRNDNTADNQNGNDNVPDPGERFTLVAQVVGGGSVEPSAGTFEAGEEVTLTATPDGGWRFDHWEGDASGEEPIIVVTIEGDTSVTAFFVSLPPDNANDNAPTNTNDNTGVDPEPGDGFDDAPVITPGGGSGGGNVNLTIEETISQADEVDVFDVGLMQPGDRFTATCAPRNNSPLDPMIALFDGSQFRVFWNDDVDLDGGDFSSRVSGLIRHSSAQHFIAVTSTDFSDTTGDYTLSIQIQRGAGSTIPVGHTIVLDFDGATNVTIAGMDWGSPPPFDAEAIDPGFAGQTATLKQSILTLVRADFAAFNMTVLSTDDPAPTGPFTNVILGGDDDELLGIADELDFYNVRRDDPVIVFALAFGGLTDNLTQMGQALANVVSHEVGHSVGLMHTIDGTELMDNSGSDLPLLSDQFFGTAPVFDFPIGQQNAPLLLNETLGPSAKRGAARGFGLRCGTCGLPLEKLTRVGQAH